MESGSPGSNPMEKHIGIESLTLRETSDVSELL